MSTISPQTLKNIVLKQHLMCLLLGIGRTREVAVTATCLSICLSRAMEIRAPQPVPFPVRAGGGWVSCALLLGMIKGGGNCPLAGVPLSMIVPC